MGLNKKGMLCFLLLACIAASITAISLKKTGNFSETKQACLELEKLDLARTVLEENFDNFLKQALLEEKENRDIENAKQNISKKISLFFEKAKKEWKKQGIEITEIPSQKFLAENTRLLVLEYKGIKIMEYCFTGGILKKNLVFGLETENAKKTLMIPAGYLQRAVVNA